MSDWFQYCLIFLLSTVKLVLGSVPMSIVLVKMNGISFIFSMFICCFGGFTGVIIFTRTGEKIWEWWDKLTSDKNKSKNISIKKIRRFIIIRNKYGLWGIALLSPILLSVPGGCMLAARFYKNTKLIYLRMFIAIVIWVWGSGGVLYWIL